MIPRKPLLTLAACLALQACDTQIAGTNNETQTKGTFFQPGGAPDVGARVRVFQAANDSQPVRQTFVDAQGNASLTGLPHGYYSVLVEDTAGRASFLDSLYSDGDNLPAPQDTVRATATVIGHIQVQPMDSPAIAWIHLMRTGIYVNVDSTGAFRITGVPSDALTLVASTLLPRYTPTFRSIRPLPDSTLDVGTIDLVYNGLPLVTGIVASYDSLSGVVTLSWKDTAYPRKDDYIVYSGQGSTPTPSQIGTSTSASFSDTIFGGFGATPSRYDSAEMDLTFWVAAQANDFTTGPVWNKVQLHVKSPALAKRWTVEWEPLVPGTFASFATMDTLATGIAVYSQVPNNQTRRHDNVLQVLHPNGSWVPAIILSLAPEMETAPLFWKGRIWRVEGRSIHGAFIDSIPSATSNWAKVAIQVPIFDSAAIFSSIDGTTWDSVLVATGTDSVSGFRLRGTSDGIHLVVAHRDLMDSTEQSSYTRGILGSPDGRTWRSESAPSPALAGFDGWPMWTIPTWENWLIPSDDGINWTILSPDVGGSYSRFFLMPGISNDTSSAMLRTPNQLFSRASTRFLALQTGTYFGIALPSSPANWQSISVPEPVRSFCFWQGKLIVLGDQGIHIATIQ